MSSKSILIILSYTVSKFARFFETQCMSTCVVCQVEKQRKLNELDIIVTLCLHQIEHIVDGAVPSDLSQCLTFEYPDLVQLHFRIEELEQERIVQKRQHQ